MWDHWRGGIFTDSETLNDENKLLKCIAEKQRKEMMLLAKQIAALSKRKEEMDVNKEKSDTEQESANQSMELVSDEDGQSETVTWALEAEINETSHVPVSIESVPEAPVLVEPVSAKLAPISTTQPMNQQQQALENGEAKVCEWVGDFGVPCNANFATADELALHVSFSHINNTSTNPEYHCLWSNCSRSSVAFKAKYKLVNHLRIHTGEKPFACKFSGCGKTFGRSENLKIHARVHTGEKPFKCQFEGCEKTFSNSSDRKKHASVHMNGVFECPLPGCERTYCHASSMRKHMMRHIKTHVKQGECTMAEAKKKLGNCTTRNLQKTQQQSQQQSPTPVIINQAPSIPITLQKTDSEVREPVTISNSPQMVQYQIVQIVPTVQPQFRIEALRNQPRKIAPKRSQSPDPEISQPVRKTRKLRNIAAKQKRSNV